MNLLAVSNLDATFVQLPELADFISTVGALKQMTGTNYKPVERHAFWHNGKVSHACDGGGHIFPS